jgi:hypothetical protein
MTENRRKTSPIYDFTIAECGREGVGEKAGKQVDNIKKLY